MRIQDYICINFFSSIFLLILYFIIYFLCAPTRGTGQRDVCAPLWTQHIRGHPLKPHALIPYWPFIKFANLIELHVVSKANGELSLSKNKYNPGSLRCALDERNGRVIKKGELRHVILSAA